jgi:hypothetical protein
MGPSDICLARFPFGGTAGVKLRPVLVLTGPLGLVPEYQVAYMTSVLPAALLPTAFFSIPRNRIMRQQA